MKRAQRFGIPVVAALGALIVPLIASSPAGAAITTTTYIDNSGSGGDQFSVANTPPKIWLAKGLTKVNGDPLDANTVTPMSTYEFEVVVEDDNTLWNSRVVICFHNTSHPVGFAGSVLNPTHDASAVTYGTVGGTPANDDGFAGQSDSFLLSVSDCFRGGNASDATLNLRDNNDAGNSGAGGLNDANPGGYIPNDGEAAGAEGADTSRSESWRKARWVLKQDDGAGTSYDVDPTASEIINDTTNNGSWRLSGDLSGAQEAESDAPCTHKTRDVGGEGSITTRWDSTLLHLQCSVRIGTLARATAGDAAADWDLFLGVMDSGTVTDGNAGTDAYMDIGEGYGNAYAFCSALGDTYGDWLGITNGAPNWQGFTGYGSCDENGGDYVAPSQFKVATNLSIGTVESKDFGTLVPPTQNVGGTSETDPNNAPATAAETVSDCKEVGAGGDAAPDPVSETSASWFQCAHAAHKIDNLVANTDSWKFKVKSGPSAGQSWGDTSTCNDPDNTKIAPALGYNNAVAGESDNYTCWYASTNGNEAGADDDSRDADQTYAVALWEPGVGTATEWDANTMRPNTFAFRCIAYPKDPNEAGTYTRKVNPPDNSDMHDISADAEVYVGKQFNDIPLYEYATSGAHIVGPAGGWDTGIPTIIDQDTTDNPRSDAYYNNADQKKNQDNKNSFDGMGSDNSSVEEERIWQRLEYAPDTDVVGEPKATPYEAYLHCRLDTGYVRPGTYTGVVYVGISDADPNS